MSQTYKQDYSSSDGTDSCNSSQRYSACDNGSTDELDCIFSDDRVGDLSIVFRKRQVSIQSVHSNGTGIREVANCVPRGGNETVGIIVDLSENVDKLRGASFCEFVVGNCEYWRGLDLVTWINEDLLGNSSNRIFSICGEDQIDQHECFHL